VTKLIVIFCTFVNAPNDISLPYGSGVETEYLLEQLQLNQFLWNPCKKYTFGYKYTTFIRKIKCLCTSVFKKQTFCCFKLKMNPGVIMIMHTDGKDNTVCNWKLNYIYWFQYN